MSSSREALTSSATDAWHTPERVLELARQLLGTIDLDPASCREAQARVRAVRWYSPPMDGLALPWFGRVWLNPPYGREDDGASSQARWSAALSDRWKRREVEEALLLVNAHVGTTWFHALTSRPFVLLERRLRFLRPDGRPGPSPTHGNAVVYFGRRHEAFAATFGELGRVVLPCGGCGPSVSRSSSS